MTKIIFLIIERFLKKKDDVNDNRLFNAKKHKFHLV
jgi:hypothetical protein